MRALVALTVVAALFVGCSKKDETVAQGQGGAAGSTGTTSRGAGGGPSEPGHGAPVVLRLSANAPPGATDVELGVQIDVVVPSDTPATLRVVLPSGASLAAGKAPETIDLKAKGTQRRELRVRASAPLTDAAPVHVILEGQSPDGKTGFRADRAWPPREATPPPTRSSGPRPPGGRPPLPSEPSLPDEPSDAPAP